MKEIILNKEISRIKNMMNKVIIEDFNISNNEMDNNIEPIKVTVSKSWTGKYFNIEGKMSYELFLKLGDNLSQEQINYGKEKDNREYSEDILMNPNDVSGTSYDYKTNDAVFTASTIQDVQNWLGLHKNYVYVD